MKCTKCGYDDKGSGDMAHICEPVNTPQRTWVGLTNQELSDCWDTIPERAMKQVEAKLKEKNT